MDAGTELKRSCVDRLHSLVQPGETISAIGTAEELPQVVSQLGSGAGWTMILLTSQRVLFARWFPPEAPPYEIRLDDVRAWAHGSQYNCHAVALTHLPVARKGIVSARRFLWFEWGNAETEVERTQTIFRFSRPDTEVARALHAALEERAIPGELLDFEERPRAERIHGSRTVLRVWKR